MQELKLYEPAYKKASEALRNAQNQAIQAVCHNTLGLACKNLGHYQEAIEHYTQAISLFDKDREAQAKAYNNLGNVYRLEKNYALAEQKLRQAIRLNETNPDLAIKARQNLLAGNYNNLAEVSISQRNYKTALPYLQKALHYLAPDAPSSAADTLPLLRSITGDRLRAMDIMRNQALCYFRQFQTDSDTAQIARTLMVYDSLLTLLTRIRSEYFGEFSKMHFAADADSILTDAVVACHAFYTHTHRIAYAQKAFVFSDLSKANVLLEQMRLRTGQRFGKVPADSLAKGRRLRKALDKVEDILTTLQPTPSNFARLEQTRAEKLRLSEEMDHLTASIRQLSPTVYGAPTTVKQVQKELLAPDQALIEYKIAGQQIFVFLITPDGFFMRRLPGNSATALDSLWAGIDSLRSGIIYGPTIPGAHAVYCSNAQALYRHLFAAVDSVLQQPRLLIVPEGKLNEIPFETLLSRVADPIKDPESLLLKRFAMGYGYSAGLLLEMKKSTPNVGLSNRVAAFAPDFKPDLRPGSAETLAEVVRHLPFRPMVYNEVEIDAIGQWALADPFKKLQATKDNFLKAAASHSVIHVSTHAFLDNTNPAYSFMVFTQAQDTLQTKELLFLRDLNSEALDIELMVFTACQTALGQNWRGEGAISMARGLATAGVKSFITTLWEVNQEKTAALIPDFYRHLAATDSCPKDQALAQAKRTFLEGSALQRYPCYWAGLIISGDMKPIALEKAGFPWVKVVLFVVLLGALGGGIWLRRRSG